MLQARARDLESPIGSLSMLYFLVELTMMFTMLSNSALVRNHMYPTFDVQLGSTFALSQTPHQCSLTVPHIDTMTSTAQKPPEIVAADYAPQTVIIVSSESTGWLSDAIASIISGPAYVYRKTMLCSHSYYQSASDYLLMANRLDHCLVHWETIEPGLDYPIGESLRLDDNVSTTTATIDHNRALVEPLNNQNSSSVLDSFFMDFNAALHNVAVVRLLKLLDFRNDRREEF